MDPKELTGAILRKLVEHHKTSGRCVEGVAKDGNGNTRFLARGELPRTDETATWFLRCPACGKEIVKHEEG